MKHQRFDYDRYFIFVTHRTRPRFSIRHKIGVTKKAINEKKVSITSYLSDFLQIILLRGIFLLSFTLGFMENFYFFLLKTYIWKGTMFWADDSTTYSCNFLREWATRFAFISTRFTSIRVVLAFITIEWFIYRLLTRFVTYSCNLLWGLLMRLLFISTCYISIRFDLGFIAIELFVYRLITWYLM